MKIPSDKIKYHDTKKIKYKYGHNIALHKNVRSLEIPIIC